MVTTPLDSGTGLQGNVRVRESKAQRINSCCPTCPLPKSTHSTQLLEKCSLKLFLNCFWRFCHLKNGTVSVCVVYSVMSTLCDPMDCSPPDFSVQGFSRQEYWSGLPFPPPGNLPDPGIEFPSLVSPALAGRFFPAPSEALEL